MRKVNGTRGAPTHPKEAVDQAAIELLRHLRQIGRRAGLEITDKDWSEPQLYMVRCRHCLDALYMAVWPAYHSWGTLVRWVVAHGRHFHWQA